MTHITAVLPAYNEEVAIGSIVIETRKYADRVIVVDDGSKDKTAEIAEIAGAEVIKHSKNIGKGAALKTGFEAVDRTDVVVTIDSDGQHDPSEIPKLIAPVINGEADLVNGSRYLGGKASDTPTYRRVGQSVLDIATNINSETHITDSQSGFRAFAAHTITLFKFRQTGFGIESEMITEASNAGLRIKEVEIGVRYDVANNKRNPIGHGMGVLVKILQDMEFNRPLYYFTIPGLILIAVGLVAGLIFFGQYLGDYTTSLAPTVIAALISILGAFISFTGIILDTLSRMITQNLNK